MLLLGGKQQEGKGRGKLDRYWGPPKKNRLCYAIFQNSFSFEKWGQVLSDWVVKEIPVSTQKINVVLWRNYRKATQYFKSLFGVGWL